MKGRTLRGYCPKQEGNVSCDFRRADPAERDRPRPTADVASVRAVKLYGLEAGSLNHTARREVDPPNWVDRFGQHRLVY